MASCSFRLIFDVCASLLFVSRLRRWFMQFSVFECYNFPFQLFSIHSFCRAQTSTKCYLVYWLLVSSHSRHFFILRFFSSSKIFFFKSVSSWNLFICASRVGFFFLFLILKAFLQECSIRLELFFSLHQFCFFFASSCSRDREYKFRSHLVHTSKRPTTMKGARKTYEKWTK